MSSLRCDRRQPSKHQHLPGATADTLVLAAVGLAWCAAVGFAALSARESEYLRTPGVRFILAAGVISTYVAAGLIAWRRRPDSQLGPLMIAAGGGTFVATLGWSNNDLLRTTGQALELLPPILFLHVYLAFPTGRLRWAPRTWSGARRLRDRDRPRTGPDAEWRTRARQRDGPRERSRTRRRTSAPATGEQCGALAGRHRCLWGCGGGAGVGRYAAPCPSSSTVSPWRC